MIRVEEEESFRKVVSENSFIDLDLETWEKDEVMAQNNDPKNGFVDVEKSKEDVEASKAKNSEESSVHGEGIKRVEDINSPRFLRRVTYRKWSQMRSVMRKVQFMV